MKLSDYISQELIDPDMETSDMEECLERLVGLLDRGGLISDPRECLQKLLDREKMMSTGIGSGLAIPHAKSEVMKQNRVAFARSRGGVEFHAQDGNPVNLIFLLIGPPDSATLHVKILASIARLTRHKSFRDRLLQADTAEEVIRLIREEEKRS